MQLFDAGKSVFSGPVRMFYHAGEGTVKAGVGVSKRHFKKASERNRIKRLMREAWRLQQHSLHNSTNLELFFIYTGNTLPSFQFIFEKTGHCISLLNKQLRKNENPA